MASALRRRSGWIALETRGARTEQASELIEERPAGVDGERPQAEGGHTLGGRKRRRTGASPGCALKSSRRRSRTTGVHAAAGRSTTERRSDHAEVGSPRGRAHVRRSPWIWSSRPRRIDPAGDQDDPIRLHQLGHRLVDAAGRPRPRHRPRDPPAGTARTGSPFFVYLRASVPMIPPTVTRSPSPRSSSARISWVQRRPQRPPSTPSNG